MLPGPTLPLKSQKRKLKSAYTGDSKRNKFRKQNYWQTAKQGCRTLSDWVQVSIIKFSGGFKLTKNQVTKQPNLQLMDVNDVYSPELDDLKNCDLPFEGTHDIELERLEIKADVGASDSVLDSDSDQDDIEFVVSI